ncbi:MAG: hypothetical protein ABSG98_02565 [Anaerolineales bacterium]
MAHIPSLPGVNAMHPLREVAVARALEVLQEEILFLEANLLPVPSIDPAIPIELDPIAENVFPEDLVPLTRGELEHLLLRMALARERFGRLARGLSPQQMKAGPAGGWKAAQIIEHVAIAECWYLDRLIPLPEDAAGAAWGARSLLIGRLHSLTEEELSVTTCFLGEEWTPRKVLRRALELETAWGAYVQSLPRAERGVMRPDPCWRGNETVESDLFPFARENLNRGINQLLELGLQLAGWLRGLGEGSWLAAPSAERERSEEALRQLATVHLHFRGRLGRWPADPLVRLAQVRIVAVQRLEGLGEKDLQRVNRAPWGETWTARKVLRRFLEHERQHYDHLRQVLAQAGE